MLFRSFQGKVRKLHCLEFLRNQQMINKKKVRKAWKGQAKTDLWVQMKKNIMIKILLMSLVGLIM